jgi:hypothetical protein
MRPATYQRINISGDLHAQAALLGVVVVASARPPLVRLHREIIDTLLIDALGCYASGNTDLWEGES